ncbi:hypothetical protein [Octadecabacter sp. R77987]|uniref:hypothetical protein n=1 Tax=Octadecabacter sp. R77987 TaxID=3093874 RepID=UPI00366E44D4
MKKFLMLGVATLALANCAQPVPDSGAGVGFGDYAQYEIDRARREAQLQGATVPAAGAPATLPAAPVVSEGAIPSSDLAAAGIGAQQTPVPQTGRTGVDATPGNAPPALVDSAGISDEQSFDAVAGRESIESDAERRAAQAAAYQLVEPTAVPERDGNVGPNIVQYALQTTNAKGVSVYGRSGLSGQARFQRNCADYRAADEAQRDFLRRGGPDRDPRGIDPDGDGFACGWDPAPFRLAAGN